MAELAYICAYFDWIDAMKRLDDAERGRLFTALLQYGMSGEEPELIGREMFTFDALKLSIDVNKRNYADKCAKMRGNGMKNKESFELKKKTSQQDNEDNKQLLPIDTNCYQLLSIDSNCREDKDNDKDKYKDNDKDEYKDNDKDNDNGKLPAEEKGVAWEGVSVVGEDIDGMSGDGVSCKSLSEKGISCKSLSDNGVFENRSSDNGGFENRVSKNGLSDENMSDNGVSAENMSENGVSEERMSENGVSEERMSDNGGFVKSLPNNGVSAWRMSENGGYADNLSENEMSVGGHSVGGGSVQGRSVPGLSVEGVVELYHGICRSYPQVLNISEKRKASIKECLKVYSPEDFTKMFSKAENSSFLKGANDHNWSATFDWFMDETNFTKILEGQFDNKAPRASPGKPGNSRFVPNPLRDTSGDMETSMAILEAEMEKMRGGEAAFG